jgi:hypothetical protein
MFSNGDMVPGGHYIIVDRIGACDIKSNTKYRTGLRTIKNPVKNLVEN